MTPEIMAIVQLLTGPKKNYLDTWEYKITWVKGMLRTTLWVKNVFDKTWYTRGFGGFSNDPRDFYEFDEPYYQLGNGRQTGVTVRYQF